MKRKIAIEIISFLFILLFIYAALNKLADYQKFVIQIGQSPLLTGFGDTIPWMVISAEIVTAVLFVIPTFRLAALFCSLCLMAMFTTYIFAILNFSSYVPCSCGGILENLGWTDHLVFNLCFVLLALVGIVLQANESEDVEMRHFTTPENSL